MKLSITTSAVIFPAISLLMLAYTNKFLSVASVIRQLTNKAIICKDDNLIRQIQNLRLRINILKVAQACGLVSLFLSVLSMIGLYSSWQFLGDFFFLFSLGFMIMSLVFAFVETMLSGIALKIELKRIEDQ